jgi:hypothetical protein
MRIIIKCENKPNEWCIIEVQGSVDPRKGEVLDGQTLGEFSVRDGKAFLIIGTHELEGKETDLPKPIAVLSRHVSKVHLSEEEVKNGESNVSMNVVGVIRKKYIFKNRPKPMVKKN